MLKSLIRLLRRGPPPGPHDFVRIDPGQFDALATHEDVAGNAQSAPDEFRTKSFRARQILDSLDAKGGVTIHGLEKTADFWRKHDPVGTDEVALRDLGIELPEAMAGVVAAQLAISAHALDVFGFER